MPHDIQDAMNNSLYLKAKKDWDNATALQIAKGARTYDKPLDWKDWTPDQLVDHQRQELVDANHYLTCLDLKMKDLLNDIQFLIRVVEVNHIVMPGSLVEQVIHKYQKEKPSE